jgi:hypothetical protein
MTTGNAFWLVLYLIFGTYMFWFAWQVLIRRKDVLPPIAPISLWLLSIFKGSEAAHKREVQMRTSGENMIYGISALLGGCLILWLAIITLGESLHYFP